MYARTGGSPSPGGREHPALPGALGRIPGPDDPASAAWNALAGVYDPELYLDVVSLGLVYGVRAAGGGLVVEMTMTMLGCPVPESLP